MAQNVGASTQLKSYSPLILFTNKTVLKDSNHFDGGEYYLHSYRSIMSEIQYSEHYYL